MIQAPRPAGLVLDAGSAARLTGGTWIGSERQVEIHGAAIDSRAVTAGCLFACLNGARADGHDFAATAVGDGAALVLASRQVSVPAPLLLVDDVPRALALLAGGFRRRYASGCTWIGIGGANGKTTTKELIAAACGAAAPGQVHATRGNLNNHLGVPLSVLATPPGMRFAVIELGANHPGEVSQLAAIAQPQVGVVVSIGPEHLEGFGDLAGVARSECELFAALQPGAPALIGIEGMQAHAGTHGTSLTALLGIIRSAAAGRRLTLVGGDQADRVVVDGTVHGDGIELMTAYGSVRIPLLGHHNLANATLAFHAALAAGVAPAAALAGLAAARPVPGRLVPRRAGRHLLLDDTYNANPASMIAGLEVLASQSGARLAVLGPMGELGEASLAAHHQVGAAAARLALPLISVGPGAEPIGEGYRAAGGTDHQHAADRTAAVGLVQRRLRAGDTAVLVKASRSAGLELVVRSLIEAATP
jgi:UDP-N-acetylmuramoyl-tripeptide--D-alanyl-D-alanine ligase